MTPFDFIKSITSTKKYLITNSLEEKEYKPFLVNLAMSLYDDTIFYANVMNINSSLTNKMQYDYYYNAIRKKNRYAKWPKRLTDDRLASVQEYYKYNIRNAGEAISILTDEQLDIIKQKLEKGGTG